jgi:hypothetical protein
MRGFKKLAAWTAAFLISTGFGLASDEAQASRYDNISVDIRSTPGTYFAYDTTTQFTFYLKNETSSTYINNGRLKASLSAGTFSDSFPVIDPTGKYNCTVSTDRTAIDCAITAAPLEIVVFPLNARMPLRSSSNPVTSVTLNWNVRFGNGDSENFIVSGVTPGANPVTLSSSSATQAEGAAITDPAFVYTGGNNNVPNSNAQSPDPKTAAATFDPKTGVFVLATIKEYETASDPRCTTNSIHCAEFKIEKKIGTADDGTLILDKAVFPDDLDEKLVFVLRIDSTEVIGKNISQSFLRYYPDGSTTDFVPLLECEKRAPLPDDKPCVAKKFVWTKGAAQKVDPELAGDWQYELWSNRNGFVAIF